MLQQPVVSRADPPAFTLDVMDSQYRVRRESVVTMYSDGARLL